MNTVKGIIQITITGYAIDDIRSVRIDGDHIVMVF